MVIHCLVIMTMSSSFVNCWFYMLHIPWLLHCFLHAFILFSLKHIVVVLELTTASMNTMYARGREYPGNT